MKCEICGCTKEELSNKGILLFRDICTGCLAEKITIIDEDGNARMNYMPVKAASIKRDLEGVC
ncbi:MAG TPA: hypothetical protein ENI27_07970 [bacterium]|nr:hypothetical protein [bacterium]